MSATTVQLTGGAFQDPEGDPLANGFLIFELSQDAQVNGTSEICGAAKIRIALDNSGNVQLNPAQYIWPNDQLSPANTYYTVTAYSARGQRVWGPNAQQVLSTPAPFNIGAWTPAAINIAPQTVTTYDIGAFFPGQYSGGQTILLLPLERTVRFSPNFAPSRLACGTNPAAEVTFTINQNGTQVATVTVSTTGAATFSCPDGVIFNAGDVLTVIAPATTDGSLANVGMLLSGSTGG